MSACRKQPPRLSWANQAAAASLFLLLSAAAWAQPSAGPTPVIATPVVQQTVTAAQTFVGSVLPVKRATIGSAVDGRVVECPIDEGDRVEAGQKLAQLLTATISLELAAAEGELDFRRQALAELENGTRPEEVEQARARMAGALARKAYQISRRDRLTSLQKRNAVSEEEFEEAQALAIEAEQNYAQAKAAHELAVAGPRAEVVAQARAQVAMQQAVVDRLQDQLNKFTIVSRFSGYVVTQHTELGQWVNRGDPVAEVVAIDEVEVVAQVVEQSVVNVTPGLLVRVDVPAIPNRIFEGRVVTTVPQADARARTFPVKVRVKNEVTPAGPLLMPGMYARVVLPVGAQQQATLVPKDAIVLGGTTPSVYTIANVTERGQQGVVTPSPVQLGVARGRLIQVIGQLPPGQLVVVEGNERLRPGQQVLVTDIVAFDEQTQTAAVAPTANETVLQPVNE